MALKGKKKSRDRGSQARRRPAAAPRPSYGAREKVRWYQTTQGLVIAFLVAATAIIFVWWWVADSRSDAEALETTQEQLQTFTTDLRTIVQNLTPLTTEIASASTLEDDELLEKTKAWKNQLADVQTTLGQVVPPSDMPALTGLVSQSMVLYGESIDLYQLVPDLEGDARDQISAKASGSFQAANNLFSIMIQLVDGERAESELQPSGLTAPGAQETAPAPDELTIPSTPGGG